MSRTSLSAVILAITAFAVPASAQYPVAVHPSHPHAVQRPFYTSADDGNCYNGQSHWAPSQKGPISDLEHALIHQGFVINGVSLIGHTHIEVCGVPTYAIWPNGALLTVKGKVVLFHAAGQITRISGPLVRSV